MSVLIGVSDMIQAYDLKSMLESWGHQVSAIAPTKDEAIRRARECLPDVVIMDPCLRSFTDGIEAAEEIRRELRTPLVYFTSLTDANTMARLEKSHPVDILIKPCSEQTVKKLFDAFAKK